jgi:hypothetical protein
VALFQVHAIYKIMGDLLEVCWRMIGRILVNRYTRARWNPFAQNRVTTLSDYTRER